MWEPGKFSPLGRNWRWGRKGRIWLSSNQLTLGLEIHLTSFPFVEITMSFADPSQFPLPETEVTALVSVTLFVCSTAFHFLKTLSVPVVSDSLYPQLISAGRCIFLRAGGCPKVLSLYSSEHLGYWDFRPTSDELPRFTWTLETSYSHPSDMWAKAVAFLPCLLRGNHLQKEIGDFWPVTLSEPQFPTYGLKRHFPELVWKILIL